MVQVWGVIKASAQKRLNGIKVGEEKGSLLLAR
jgi:hypothetical protein